MFKAEFKLEAITPIFMRGADQTKAEIRASSIKGLMRWWFRALAHGVLMGNLKEIEALRRIKHEEDRIFGCTGSKSKFSVSVKYNDLKLVDAPHSYFSFGLKGKGLIGSFKVNLQIFDDRFRDLILSTFLAFGFLGSVGQRNRRAFGSIMIKDTNADFNFEVSFSYSPREFIKVLKQIIQTFEEYFEVKQTRNIYSIPIFPAIHPEFFKMKLGHKSYESWESAVLDLSKNLRSFRESNVIHRGIIKNKQISYRVTKQYDDVKRAIRGNRNVTFPYSAFGLPHQYNFLSMELKGVIIEGKKYKRRASSLFFKIIKRDNYVPMIMLFDYVFLPEGETLQLRWRNKIFVDSIPQPTLTVVKNYFDRFDGNEIRW